MQEDLKTWSGSVTLKLLKPLVLSPYLNSHKIGFASDNEIKISFRKLIFSRKKLFRKFSTMSENAESIEATRCDCKCYQNGFEAGAKMWRKNFTRLRQQLRQILYEKNIGSNPAVDDQWIIDELRKLLNIENSPHRHLNLFD